MLAAIAPRTGFWPFSKASDYADGLGADTACDGGACANIGIIRTSEYWFLFRYRNKPHKVRNVLSHLPKEQHEQARATLRAAWKLEADAGIRKLEQYASWLEQEWPSAAASLREGLAEMFTVNRLGQPKELRRCLTSTNLIDSSHAGVRQHTRRVSRWRNEDMAVRWAAVAFRETEKHYRRILDYQHLWILKAHLDEEDDGALAETRKVG